MSEYWQNFLALIALMCAIWIAWRVVREVLFRLFVWRQKVITRGKDTGSTWAKTQAKEDATILAVVIVALVAFALVIAAQVTYNGEWGTR